MVLDSQKRTQLLERLDVVQDKGLSTDEASSRRQEVGHFNTVDPPIQCPAWICCLLPCIKHIPSMKAYRQMQPEDAEVLRDGRWIRYDASSLVRGDIVRLEEGDVVPADCMVLQLEDGCEEVVVDHRLIQGGSPLTNPTQMYYGEQLVVGSCLAVCTAIGPETRMARLIQQGKFPSDNSPVMEEDEEAGISLIERSASREIS